jgi:beta-galactosidase
MSRFFLWALLFLTLRIPAFSDTEEMFPPAPEARSSIDFDGKGFIVNGQRTFFASGSIHYPRVPRELWHDRLLRLKRAGFSTVQTYTFWNYHEPKEGQFDFTGSHDFEAFLKEAQDLGLYSTVRVGPYVCAEWDSGGYPVWLKFKPGLEVREHNAPYEAAQDAWFAELLPKVAAHQVNKGGNVILVQLENEGGIQGAWTGPTSGDAYFDHLRDVAVKDGIQVPSFMSGYHHGSVPWLDNPDNSGRQAPWISTETWAGWFNSYGQSDYGYLRILRCNDYILARGGAGQNYYMFLGGTNFDSWNDNENPACYDYGATVGESGDIRPVYFAEKANNLFATSFADILSNGTYALPEYADYAKNGFITGARKSPAGTVVFVEGKVSNTDPALVKSIATGADVAIHIPALEACKLVLDYPIIPAAKIKIAQAITNILGIARNGTTTTFVVFGQPGDTNEITLDIDGTKKTIPLTYSTTMPTETFEKAGGQTLRILAMSRQLSDRTWIVGKPNEQYVVVGPEYCGDFSMQDGKPSLTIERPYGHPAPNQVVVYGPAETPAQHLAVVSDSSVDTAPAPTLTDWQMSRLAGAAPDFDDSTWKTTDDPQPMGADGDISAFAWYRATAQVPDGGHKTLAFRGAADHLIVFVNGKRVDATPSIVNPKPTSDDLKAGNLSWQASPEFLAGKNSIAVLVTHQGRDKGPKSGPIDHYYEKGIFKGVDIVTQVQNIPVKGWKMRGGLPDPATLSYQPLSDANLPTFFRATFNSPRPSVGANPILRFDTTALSRGTVFLNGHCIGRFPSTIKYQDKPVGMYLPECWFAPDGKNTLIVFDEEGKSPAQSPLQVETAASREIIAVSKPADSALAFQLPPYTPVDLRPSGQPNTASDRPATASSSAPGHPITPITTGDPQGWWSPATEPTDDKPAIISLDLQQPRHLLASEIIWFGDAFPFPYRVEGSADGQNWRVLVDKWQTHADPASGGGTIDRFTNGENIRYLRLTIGGSNKPDRHLGIREWRAWDVYHNG